MHSAGGNCLLLLQNTAITTSAQRVPLHSALTQDLSAMN